jgi:hypothetical protein
MKLTNYLDKIEKLVRGQNCADEVNACTNHIREQVEAYDRDAPKLRVYKKRIADLQKSIAALRQGVATSRFRESDPASHVLHALASLGEESYAREDVADRAKFPLRKVDYFLEMLQKLGDVEIKTVRDKKQYKLNTDRLDVYIQHGIV